MINESGLSPPFESDAACRPPGISRSPDRGDQRARVRAGQNPPQRSPITLRNQFHLEPAVKEVRGCFQPVGLRVFKLQVTPLEASERTKAHHFVHFRVGDPQPVVEPNPLPRLKVAHGDQG
jgi:hypothetical protein